MFMGLTNPSRPDPCELSLLLVCGNEGLVNFLEATVESLFAPIGK
jgi:hypothetical protein